MVSSGVMTATGFTVGIANINPGEHYVLQVSGTLIGTSTQTNTAAITSGTCTVCTGTWTANYAGETHLILTKTGDKSLYQSEDSITYTIAVYNDGTT